MDSRGCVLLEIKRNCERSLIRIDPAPSRLKYRLNRFWLRKSFRLSLILFIPMLVGLVSIVIVGTKYDLALLVRKNVQKFSELIAHSPAFKVIDLSIISDDPIIVEKIKTSLALKFPLSSLDIKVGTLKDQVEKLNFVRSATVRLTSNGFIEIEVAKREPVAIQRVNEEFLLLDDSGVEVDKVTSRSKRSELPLLVGVGADLRVREALSLLLEMRSLITRVRGLIFIGERRWDIILDRNQIIKLPEIEPIKALKKIISLQEGRQLLDRDVLYLDFRNMDRPVLGLTDETSKELRELRNLVRGENV